MNSQRTIRLTSIEDFTEPFQYFIAVEGFGEALSLDILRWLETEAPWELVETDFYEQYEFSLSDVQIPPHLTFLNSSVFLDDLRNKAEQIFEVRLGHQIDCTVHKLIPGQRIRIHNDFIPGGETHRVLIQLNRGWDDSNGGFLMFFNSQDPSDLHKVFTPSHDSAVGFAISEKSNHAVSAINGGDRFTFVYSFYAKSDD